MCVCVFVREYIISMCMCINMCVCVLPRHTRHVAVFCTCIDCTKCNTNNHIEEQFTSCIFFVLTLLIGEGWIQTHDLASKRLHFL